MTDKQTKYYNDIITILTDNKLKLYLKTKYNNLYEEHKTDIYEWALDSVDKYDETRSSLKTYLINILKYKFYSIIVKKKPIEMIDNYDLNQIPDKDHNFNNIDTHDLFVEIIDNFEKTIKRKSKVSYKMILRRYIGIEKSPLDRKQLQREFNISSQYIYNVFDKFIKYIRNNKYYYNTLKNIHEKYI